MCFLVTFAVPDSSSGAVPSQILDRSGAPLYEVREFSNDGGSHTYPEGFTTYSVMGAGEECSCEVTMKRRELRECLSSLASEAGELQYLIHDHRGFFATEEFGVVREVELVPKRLSKRHDEADTRYVIRARPL